MINIILSYALSMVFLGCSQSVDNKSSTEPLLAIHDKNEQFSDVGPIIYRVSKKV